MRKPLVYLCCLFFLANPLFAKTSACLIHDVEMMKLSNQSAVASNDMPCHHEASNQQKEKQMSTLKSCPLCQHFCANPSMVSEISLTANTFQPNELASRIPAFKLFSLIDPLYKPPRILTA